MPALFPWLGLAHALAGPPALRDEEPLPRPRAPELARRPVELLPKAAVTLPTCGSGQEGARCQELGPALGGELAALYRASPYFAFGGNAAYAVAHGSLNGGALTAETLSLGVVGRVYLLEAGALDPYLEVLFGWGSMTTTLEAPTGLRDGDTAFGPLGRAGGGIDWLLSPSVKVGVTGGFGALLLERGERCRSGYCSGARAPGGAMNGGVTAGLELGILLGDSL